MGFLELIAKVERWSFFFVALACLMGSFVHFNIQFGSSECDDAVATLALRAQADDNTLNVKCLGRNLVYLENEPLATDSNKQYWRTVFTLNPDQFVKIWSPFFLSMLALVQNFQGFKWDMISGNVLKSFFYVLFWMIFAVIGYSANWGVVVGIGSALWLGLLDIILILTRHGDEVPVLQFDLGALSKMRARSNTTEAPYDEQAQPPIETQKSDAPILDSQEQQVNNMINVNDMQQTISDHESYGDTR